MPKAPARKNPSVLYFDTAKPEDARTAPELRHPYEAAFLFHHFLILFHQFL